MTTNKQRRPQLLIRGIPLAVKRRCEQLAKADGRTLSAWIRKLLADVAERGGL